MLVQKKNPGDKISWFVSKIDFDRKSSGNASWPAKLNNKKIRKKVKNEKIAILNRFFGEILAQIDGSLDSWSANQR